MTILAVFSYIAMIFAAAGPFKWLTRSGAAGRDKRRTLCMACAVLSFFALPWGGIPLFHYIGLGSWMWFPCAGASLALMRPGRTKRKIIAAVNTAAVTAALYAFMLKIGVPGDIPSIEGPASITSLEGIIDGRTSCALSLFFISLVISYAPVRSGDEREASLLSFSCSSFLALLFVPPAHMFAELEPRSAIILDFAAYFCIAEIIHLAVIGTLSQIMRGEPKYSAIAAASLTVCGIYLLFGGLL